MNPFDEKAESWDSSPQRREMARRVFEAMSGFVRWDPAWRALDAGAGTGLLTLAVAHRISHVTAVDTSARMLEVLAGKAAGMPVETRLCPLESLDLPPGTYDAVVSSMALHHAFDTGAALAGFARVLRCGGHLLIADLDQEDGTFHADNTGVHHFGFDREALALALALAGFGEVRFTTAWNLEKTITGGHLRAFPIFCLHAIRV